MMTRDEARAKLVEVLSNELYKASDSMDEDQALEWATVTVSDLEEDGFFDCFEGLDATETD